MKRELILSAVLAVSATFAGTVFAKDAPATPRPVGLAEKDEPKGEKKDLGKKEIGGYTIQATQVGDVKAGEEAMFILVLSGGAGKPTAIRTWVGVESAEGSIKEKAEDEEKEWHAHVKVSKPIPAKSKFWVEVETAAGKKKGSFDYK